MSALKGLSAVVSFAKPWLCMPTTKQRCTGSFPILWHRGWMMRPPTMSILNRLEPLPHGLRPVRRLQIQCAWQQHLLLPVPVEARDDTKRSSILKYPTIEFQTNTCILFKWQEMVLYCIWSVYMFAFLFHRCLPWGPWRIEMALAQSSVPYRHRGDNIGLRRKRNQCISWGRNPTCWAISIISVCSWNYGSNKM